MPTKLIYLASPYTHRSPDVRWRRVRQAARFAADLTIRGVSVFSPIAHSGMLCNEVDDMAVELNNEIWMPLCRQMVDVSACVAVYMLDGWSESAGVTEEIARAHAARKGIYYVHAGQIDLDVVADSLVAFYPMVPDAEPDPVQAAWRERRRATVPDQYRDLG